MLKMLRRMTRNIIRSKRRLVLLVVIAFTLLIGVLGYKEYILARPIGMGPAGPSVSSADFASTWTERSVHVLGIGDSITAGMGARSQRHAFFRRVIANPMDEHEQMKGVSLSSVLPNLTWDNYAISGSESSTHEDVIAEMIPKFTEDIFGIVLMTSGGNDLIHMYGKSPPRECAMYGATLEQAEPWIQNFERRLGRMVQAITDRFPGGCEIYLGDIYDPTDGVGDAPSIYLPRWPDGLRIHARYNQAIRSCAASRDNVFVVGLHGIFLGHGSHCRQFWNSNYRADDPHYWFYHNVEDPNDRGHDAIRRAFINAIVNQTSLRVRPNHFLKQQRIPARRASE